MATQGSYKGIHQSNAVQHPVEYEQMIYQKGLQYERPPFSFRSQDWESQAEERMSAESRGYVVGNAGTGETARKNREAFSKWSIVPRRLIKTEGLPDMTANVLNHCLQFPIALAPVGVQRMFLLHSWLLISHTNSNQQRIGIFNPDGEEATARAAAKQNVPYIMSTASSTSIEDVAKANGKGVRWFQLYWPRNEHNDITVSLLHRAKNAGFTALVVTLDTYILGWRPSDMDNGYFMA